MKKTNPTPADEMRSEYDFASMKDGVRGKYAGRAREGTNIVKAKTRKPSRAARG